MKLVSFACSILVAVLPMTVSAQGAAPAPASQTAVTAGGKPGSDKIECRTMDVTGSRLQKRRECHTAAEWTEIRMRDRQTIERTQANRYNGNSGG